MIPRCSVCHGRQRVYTTRTAGLSRLRYLRCDNCGATDKQILRLHPDGTILLSGLILPHSTQSVADAPEQVIMPVSE